MTKLVVAIYPSVIECQHIAWCWVMSVYVYTLVWPAVSSEERGERTEAATGPARPHNP